MRTVDATLDIACAPEELFDFMLDAQHATEWRDLITRMDWLDGGPVKGARARLIFWSEGRERIQELTLVECDRPRRYRFENHSDGFRSTWTNTIVPTASGSRLTCTVDVVGDTIWGTLLLPFMRKRHRQRSESVFGKLKVAAERNCGGK